MNNLELFEEPVNFESIKAKVLDRIVNNPRAGVSQSWFAEVVAEICVEIKSIKEKLDSLQADQFHADGLRILEKNIKVQEKGQFAELEPPRGVKLTANETWDPAAGFFSVEWNNEGVPFRWTGPQRSFRFLLNFDRKSPSHVVLTILFKPDWINFDEMKCRIDGSEQNHQIFEVNSMIEIHLNCSINSTSSFIDIEFELPNVKHADHPDTRILGVPVNSLRVESIPEAV